MKSHGVLVFAALLMTSSLTAARAEKASPQVTSLVTLPAALGDVFEVQLSPELGYVETENGKHSLATFQFELMDGERIAILMQSDVALGGYIWRKDPEAKGIRPGWKSIGFGVSKAGKADTGYIWNYEKVKAGTYQVTLATQHTGVTARARIAFVNNNNIRFKKAEFESLLSRAIQVTPSAAPVSLAERGMAPPPVLTSKLPESGEAYVASKAIVLQPFYRSLYADGEHNAVVNFEKLGLAAMEQGHFLTAEWAFDEALKRIEAIYAKDKNAAAARSKWTKEGIKDFKGEPYERSMAYYYRGLLYLRAGDYENARAAFLTAEYQDSVAEGEEFQADFGLMNYLAGWSSRCAGDGARADELFEAARRHSPELTPPLEGDDTIVIAELGQGPVKVKRGQQSELLTFSKSINHGAAETVTIFAGDKEVPLREAASIVYQASTRGGRPVDAILKGKAVFRSGTGEAAKLVTDAVSGLVRLSTSAGVVGGVVGLGFALLSDSAKPDADIRMWDSLPDRVRLGTHSSGAGKLKVSYAGTALEAPKELGLTSRSGSCGVVWTRSHSALKIGAGVPGNEASAVASRSKKNETVQQDERFRRSLEEADTNSPVTEAVGRTVQ